MNTNALFALMNAKNTFAANHPKVMAFVRSFAGHPLTEGSVIEITVTRPGEEPVSANMRVKAEDLALLEQLKALNLK